MEHTTNFMYLLSFTVLALLFYFGIKLCFGSLLLQSGRSAFNFIFGLGDGLCTQELAQAIRDLYASNQYHAISISYRKISYFKV